MSMSWIEKVSLSLILLMLAAFVAAAIVAIADTVIQAIEADLPGIHCDDPVKVPLSGVAVFEYCPTHHKARSSGSTAWSRPSGLQQDRVDRFQTEIRILIDHGYYRHNPEE